jgi:Transposase DDE domain
VPKARRDVSAEDRTLALRGSRGLIDEHLHRLRSLPAHGNRVLHVDQLVLALLLSFFDPLSRSLRGIEACGDFDGVIDLPRLARSTTADALAVFDPACLAPLIDDLRRRVPDLRHADADLAGVSRKIVAADGTYLTTVCDVAWALKHSKRDGRTQGQVRANVQMDVAGWTPRVVTVSGDDHESEPSAFAKDLLPGVLYVVDRNFIDFRFISAVLERGSDLVLRVKANSPGVKAAGELPLAAADAEAGVVSDRIVTLPGPGAPPGRFRLVTIRRKDRNGKDDAVRLLSNLVDPAVAARVIGAAYRLRWQIELFFKWLKTWARMDHLLSASRNGIAFQLYVAVIAVLMMHVQSGRRVSKYSLIALGRVARGQMALQEAMAVIAKFERERALERARQARLRARKKLA